MAVEDAVLTYFKKKEDKPDMITHKFKVNAGTTSIEKKVRTPMFKAEGPEALLIAIREFKTMTTSYSMLTTNIGAISTYEMFRESIRGVARDTWDEILQDASVCIVGVFNQSTFNSHTNAFQEAFINEDAYDDQREYLRTTSKPRDMKAKDWVMCMKVINSYLKLLAANGRKFTEEQLVKNCITPNIPKAWKKDFKLGRGNLCTTCQDALVILKLIEQSDKSDRYKRDDKRNNSKNGNGKNGKNNKFNNQQNGGGKAYGNDKNKLGAGTVKNKCRHHPQGNHDWKDYFKNPASKDYKGNIDKPGS